MPASHGAAQVGQVEPVGRQRGRQGVTADGRAVHVEEVHVGEDPLDGRVAHAVEHEIRSGQVERPVRGEAHVERRVPAVLTGRRDDPAEVRSIGEGLEDGIAGFPVAVIQGIPAGRVEVVDDPEPCRS